MSFQYTYDTISALIFAYKVAGSTPATGRMAVLPREEEYKSR